MPWHWKPVLSSRHQESCEGWDCYPSEWLRRLVWHWVLNHIGFLWLSPVYSESSMNIEAGLHQGRRFWAWTARTWPYQNFGITMYIYRDGGGAQTHACTFDWSWQLGFWTGLKPYWRGQASVELMKPHLLKDPTATPDPRFQALNAFTWPEKKNVLGGILYQSEALLELIWRMFRSVSCLPEGDGMHTFRTLWISRCLTVFVVPNLGEQTIIGISVIKGMIKHLKILSKIYPGHLISDCTGNILYVKCETGECWLFIDCRVVLLSLWGAT